MADSGSSLPTETERIGRFEIIRVLGIGSQGTVYLAQDTHLERPVALKTLHPATSGVHARIESIRRMLEEARTASKLLHPNIVTLFDAAEERGSPYLVFEYVEGRTLAAVIREQGSIPPTQAVEIALQLLQGAGHAHAAGIAHRDLKPANVMLTADGTPRIMDFGIAGVRAGWNHNTEEILGSPGYMAPEAVERKEHTTAGDLFAVGAILHEMLTGCPAIRGKTAADILRHTLETAVDPPSARAPTVGPQLDAIVMKALAKDPAQRFASAASMADALSGWLNPSAPAPGPEGSRATLEFLLLRMRHCGDFPALAATISAVNAAATSEAAPIEALCEAILKDFALTKRLLHRVNSPYYRRHGGTISTVSRAVTIVGVEGIRSIALSLAVFEHLARAPGTDALRDEIVAAYFSGVVAQQLAKDLAISNSEEVFICAMFQRLGKLLVTFYLHEEALAIARLVDVRAIDEEQASAEVLGMTFEELGIGVARRWHFPERIVESMRVTHEPSPLRAGLEGDEHRILSGLANGLCDMLRESDKLRRNRILSELVALFGTATGLSAPALAAAVRQSAEVLASDTQALGFSSTRSPLYVAARDIEAH